MVAITIYAGEYISESRVVFSCQHFGLAPPEKARGIMGCRKVADGAWVTCGRMAQKVLVLRDERMAVWSYVLPRKSSAMDLWRTFAFFLIAPRKFCDGGLETYFASS